MRLRGIVLVSSRSCLPLSCVALEEKAWAGLLASAEEGLSPGPLLMVSLFMPHFKACWDAGRSHSCAAWKVCAGVSGHIYLKPVYSTMPGALVNGVYHPPLFFVHLANVTAVHTTQGSHGSGRNPSRLETLGHVTALFLLTSFRHRPLPPFASCHTMRVSNQNLSRFAR